jgi:regulator of replication initiation timing
VEKLQSCSSLNITGDFSMPESSGPDGRVTDLERKLQAKQEEIAQLKRKLKLSYRDNSILELLTDEMKDFITPISPLPSIIDVSKNQEAENVEHLVMHISDQHADQVVIPSHVGGTENYNLTVALCRAEKYVETTLDFTRNMVSRSFPVLWMLFYGDHVSGEIHGAEPKSFYRNMFRNSIAVGEMNALMIRDLAPFFRQINILCLPGNHGRRSIKKDYEGARNNWDYLVFETMRMLTKEITNLQIMIPDCYSYNVDINGYGFSIFHGDDILSYNSLPWYGIERKTRRLTALNSSIGKTVQYYVFGHFHKSTMMQDLNGETIINGSWVATTPFLYERFSSYSEPYQWIHGVHPRHGITWRLPVNLRDQKKEKIGPDRYSITLPE